MFMYSDYSQHLLDHVKKIHFIGCGGSGMYPLIQILAAKGYELSGSDVLDGSIIRYEREMGVKVSLGHNADNVVGADMVVYSAAISKDNVELNAAASYGIPTVERSVLLGYVSRLYKQSICVSGTHGKTTTTSMITTALELAGRDPSAVIGGKLPPARQKRSPSAAAGCPTASPDGHRHPWLRHCPPPACAVLSAAPVFPRW